MVLSSLQSLAIRLEELQTNDSTVSSIPNEALPDALSVEEYSKVFSTGYLRLPPLKLGWIAQNLFKDEGLQDWECRRSAVLYFLARECGLPSNPAFSNMIEEIHDNQSLDQNLRKRLQKAWTPKFEQVFQCLLEQNSGHAIPMLVQLRGDLLRLMAVLPKNQGQEMAELKGAFQQLEGHIRQLLSTWFSPGMLGMPKTIVFIKVQLH